MNIRFIIFDNLSFDEVISRGSHFRMKFSSLMGPSESKVLANVSRKDYYTELLLHTFEIIGSCLIPGLLFPSRTTSPPGGTGRWTRASLRRRAGAGTAGASARTPNDL